MICQSKLLSACVRVVVCEHNCYPYLFPLQNNSSGVTTATAGSHYHMNQHPRRASSLCAQMENPTLLAPWCSERDFTPQARKQSKHQSKADVMWWKTRTAEERTAMTATSAASDRHLSFLFSFSCDSPCLSIFPSFLCWHQCIWHIFYSVNLCFI